MPTIRLPDGFRRYTGGRACLEVSGGTVAEALAAAFVAHPDLRIRLVDEAGRVRSHLAVFRNEGALGRDGLDEVPLTPADTLTILEAIGGGAL